MQTIINKKFNKNKKKRQLKGWVPKGNLGFHRNKKAQVWVETVIYTLIGLAIIAIVLAVVRPKIAEIKDKAIIEQTITALNELDQQIIDARQAPGNIRVIDFRMKKGKLIFDGGKDLTPNGNDTITYILEDSRHKFSEPGENITYGRTKIRTDKKQEKKRFIVSIWLEYKNINITYSGKNEEKTFFNAPTPYKIQIENKGEIGGKTNMDITEVS